MEHIRSEFAAQRASGPAQPGRSRSGLPRPLLMAFLGAGADRRIIAELPDLTPEDVRAALRYAAEAVREREFPLRRTA